MKGIIKIKKNQVRYNFSFILEYMSCKTTLVLKRLLRKKKSFQYSKGRSSHWKSPIKKGVIRNLARFKGKYLCKNLFLIKLKASACSFIKKETLAEVFSCEFGKIYKNTFLILYLLATASQRFFILEQKVVLYAFHSYLQL